MSDVDTMQSTEQSQKRIALIEGARSILAGLLRGLTRSGLFNPLILISALGFVVNDFVSEYLIESARLGGRMDYEAAKKTVINIQESMRDDLDTRTSQLETLMTQQDLERVGGTPGERVN